MAGSRPITRHQDQVARVDRGVTTYLRGDGFRLSFLSFFVCFPFGGALQISRDKAGERSGRRARSVLTVILPRERIISPGFGAVLLVRPRAAHLRRWWGESGAGGRGGGGNKKNTWRTWESNPRPSQVTGDANEMLYP